MDDTDCSSFTPWLTIGVITVVYFLILAWIYKRGRTLFMPVSDAVFPYTQRVKQLKNELAPLLVDAVHFEVTEECLGQGSTGFVFKGSVFPRSDSRYKSKILAAIKMTYPIPCKSVSLLEEASRLSLLVHPNIVRVLAISRDSFDVMRPAIALEWLQGGSLANYFKENIRCHEDERDRPVVFLRDVLNILLQMANALRHMHETSDRLGHQMVHGDVAARNVLMTQKQLNGCTVKLGDFGVPEGAARRPIAWLPPEVLCAQDDKAKNTQEGDVWMFGVFAWECLTLGATPHYQRSISAIERCFRLPDRGLPCPHSCPLDVWTMILDCLSDAHRRPRCAGREDVTSSLIRKIKNQLTAHENSSHRVQAMENVSNCCCTEHRCKGGVSL